MGKAYESGKNVVVEMTTGDIVKRYFETEGKTEMSVHEVVRKIAWKIGCTTPKIEKMLKGKNFKWATVEALEGIFVVTFRTDDPNLSGGPDQSTPCKD